MWQVVCKDANAKIEHSYLAVMSLETWSRSQESSREPILQVSISEVSGLVSVSKAIGLSHKPIVRRHTLNTTSIWLNKTVIQRVFSLLYLQEETMKTGWKNVRNMKKINLASGDKILFEKFRQNPQIMKSLVLVSEFLMKSQPQI